MANQGTIVLVPHNTAGQQCGLGARAEHSRSCSHVCVFSWDDWGPGAGITGHWLGYCVPWAEPQLAQISHSQHGGLRVTGHFHGCSQLPRESCKKQGVGATVPSGPAWKLPRVLLVNMSTFKGRSAPLSTENLWPSLINHSLGYQDSFRCEK